MTNDEIIDILVSNRPERPRSLQHKKLQIAIDEAISHLTEQTLETQKYEQIKSLIAEWEALENKNTKYDAIYFHRIIDVIRDVPD